MSTFVCPYWDDFSRNDFDLLFTKASLTRKSNTDMFYYTHTPIKVKDQNGNELNEQEILDVFSHTDPRKGVVVIQGNSGTGKSELCVYLSLELAKMERTIFHIEKNSSLIDILTRDIPSYYKEITGDDFPVLSELTHLSTHIRKNPGVIASSGVSGLIIRLMKENLLPDSQENKILNDKLAELVTKNIVILTQKSVEPKDMVFVTEDVLRSGPYRIIFDILPWDDIETCVEETNKILWEEIRQKYNVPGLDEAITALVKVCKTRPVIIFEDFSVAGLDLQKLSLFMENDSTDAVCDFIIAGLQEKVPSRTGTRVDRFRYFETTQSGSQGVLFLDDDSCVDFITPFLNYPKQGRQSIESKDHEAEDQKCNRCSICPKNAQKLVPLNANVINRVYSGLDSTKKTPRRFVEEIGQILLDYKIRGIPPSDSRAIINLPVEFVVDDVKITSESDKRFFEWFGTKEDKFLRLDDFLQALFSKDLSQYRQKGVIKAPILGNIIGPDPIDEIEVDQEFNNISGQVSIWKRNITADQAKDFFVCFRSGLRYLIKEYSNSYKLNPRSQIKTNVGRNEYPFLMENTNSVLQAVSFSPSEFSQNGAIQVARLGYNIENKKSLKLSDGQSLPEIVFKANHLPISKMIREYRENIENNLKSSGWSKVGYPRTMKQISIACSSILMSLLDPLTDISEKAIIEWLTNSDDIVFNNLDEFNYSTKSNINNIIDNQGYIKTITIDLFGLTRNSYDANQIWRNIAIHPFHVLNYVKQNNPFKNLFVSDKSVNEIINPYRKMDTFFHEIEEYLLRCKMDYSHIGTYLENIPRYLSDVDIDECKKLFDILKQYEGMDKEILSYLNILCTMSQEQMDNYKIKINKILKLYEKSGNNKLYEFRSNISLKNISEDPITSLLSTLKYKIDTFYEERDTYPLLNLFSYLEDI